jgi:hypothetical protein
MSMVHPDESVSVHVCLVSYLSLCTPLLVSGVSLSLYVCLHVCQCAWEYMSMCLYMQEIL